MHLTNADPAQYVAVVDHAYGQTRSGLMGAKLALKVAKLWIAHGDRGVRIESRDGQTSWTPHDFGRLLVSTLR